MQNFILTRITELDLETLQSIGKQSFYETFADSNDEENMRLYLDENFSLEKLKQELNTQGSEFYFIHLEEKPIAYLKINFAQAQTELKDPSSMEIERIYVLNEYHGHNFGQTLFDKALQRAIEENISYLWLGVWEENKRAVNFYKKNGFVVFDQHIFKFGPEDQTDLMMKLDLKQTNFSQ